MTIAAGLLWRYDGSLADLLRELRHRRYGSYTALCDPTTQCIALDGQWQLQVGDASRTTTVTGIKRCDGMCPAAGGLIQHTGFRGRTITLTLDGTAVAQWQSSSGRSGTIDLACGG